MVTVKDFKTITKSEGESFYALILQGGVEPVKSEKTGRIYFTARTSTVPTTFDKETCKNLVGTQFNGEIRRIDCEPYQYVIEDSGEVLQLTHRWEYVDENLEVLNQHVMNANEKII
ncbi:MAG: hypothetical protein V7691_00870 [Galbibacter orientalis]|uniref:hypothetical protein n=1 Tax=Galbibacter orientalis TaxID=453852 RepID=UPI003002F2AC